MSEPQFEERMMAWIERRWLLATLVVFVGACCWFLWDRWGQIHWLALSDTDDNLRLAQVKAWLAGQSWFDLRQHRLAPPDGLNIHWSRIVDLPIAGILLISRPLVGELAATRIACAVAPMLAMAPALIAIVFAVRRLVHPRAYPIAFAIMMCAQVTLFMWMPLRIDHHGWQLAMLALVVAGLADRDGRRGGAVAGGATAVSFGIGLELIPMMALAGVSIALRWAFDPDETPRLRAYAVVLGGGCALAFAGFASWDNRAMVCDVLSPVYLATLSLTAALLVGISFMPAGGRVARLVLLSVAGIVIAAFFALSFPQCLHRPEAISPELERLWFVNIREVKPLYTKPWRDALDVAWLPVVGTVGAWLALWRARHGDGARLGFGRDARPCCDARSLLAVALRTAGAAHGRARRNRARLVDPAEVARRPIGACPRRRDAYRLSCSVGAASAVHDADSARRERAAPLGHAEESDRYLATLRDVAVATRARSAAGLDDPHLRRFRAAAGGDDKAERDCRPLSSQRPGDPGRPTQLPRSLVRGRP